MALSTILRRSASSFICGGNRFYGNLIFPSASVSAFRQLCSSPSPTSRDTESLVEDAKRPSLDESLVNDLISQVQSLQRDIELLRNSYSKPLFTVKEDESLVKGEGVDDSESAHKGVDDDSSLKGIAIESSKDEVEDSESDKSDEDSNDEGKGSDSDDISHDSSNEKLSSDSDKSNDELLSETDDTTEKLSSDSDKSNDESLSETDDNNEHSDHESLSESGEPLPERDDDSVSGDTLAEPDDESLPKSKENEQLLKGIESEILRAKTFMQLSAPGAVIPVDFPFKIRNDYYGNTIVLSHKYEGELVEVKVENPTIFSNRQCNDYNEKKSSSFSMDLTVVVSCLSSKLKKFELKCGARPEGISVYSARDPADESDSEGVHMSDFNENLKEEFGKYLEARGVTLSTTNFIYGYMLDKANKERLRILENIQKMVA